MPLDEPSRKHRQSESSTSPSDGSSCDSVFSEDASLSSMPSPPDGGYGWMIVFSAFMINLISDGISFSFGILYTELLDYFGESKSLTSWVGSLFYGMCLMGGPLASALATKYGCRKVLIGGGTVACIGTFISAFATNIWMLIITFGVITGLGMSMGYVSSVVMVAFYFEDKRALATGLAVCGSGIGTFVFAPLTEYLIVLYGWRGTMIIWSGIILNLVICGSLLRPLEFTPRERRERALLKFERISRTISFASVGKNNSRHTSHIEGLDEIGKDSYDDANALDYCHSQIQIPTFLKETKINIPNEVLIEADSNRLILKNYVDSYFRENRMDVKDEENDADDDFNTRTCETMVTMENIKGFTQVQLVNGYANKNGKPHGSCLKNSTNRITKDDHASKSTSSRPTKQVRMSNYLPLYKKGLFFKGNLNRVCGVRSRSCPELSRRSVSMTESDSSSEDDWDYLWQYLHFSKHMKRVLKTLFDPSILMHPLYVVFAISNFILYFWYDVPYIFMSDRAIEIGMSESKASFLISVLGIVNTFGQIVYGFIGDRNVNLSLLYGFSLIACGSCVVVVPLFTTFNMLAVASGLFGLFISVNYSLSTVILVEYLGLDKLSNAYGLMMLVQGIANLIGPPVAASLYDSTQSYDLTFFAGGGFIMLSGLWLLFVPVLRRLRRQLEMDEVTRSCTTFNASNTINLVIEAPKVAASTTEEPNSSKEANTAEQPNSTLLINRKDTRFLIERETRI